MRLSGRSRRAVFGFVTPVVAIVGAVSLGAGIMAASCGPPPTTTTTSTTTTTFPVVRDDTNTGPSGPLTPTPCVDHDITVAFTVVQDVELGSPSAPCSIRVLADNVTFTNFRIFGRIVVGEDDSTALIAPAGVRIDTGDFVGAGYDNAISVVADADGAWTANNFHGYENCVTEWTGTRDEIDSNYCHAEASQSSAPHYDGFEVYGTSGGITITGNNVQMSVADGATAPVNVTPSPLDSGTVYVVGNVLRSANCSYVVLGDDRAANAQPYQINLVNNRLGLAPGSECGYWVLHAAKSGTFCTVEQNRDLDTLALLPSANCTP